MERSKWGRQRHIWVRGGRTTEEAEATYCSSLAGKEGRGEMRLYVGVKREIQGKEIAEKNVA